MRKSHKIKILLPDKKMLPLIYYINPINHKFPKRNKIQIEISRNKSTINNDIITGIEVNNTVYTIHNKYNDSNVEEFNILDDFIDTY